MSMTNSIFTNSPKSSCLELSTLFHITDDYTIMLFVTNTCKFSLYFSKRNYLRFRLFSYSYNRILCSINSTNS